MAKSMLVLYRQTCCDKQSQGGKPYKEKKKEGISSVSLQMLALLRAFLFDYDFGQEMLKNITLLYKQ